MSWTVGVEVAGQGEIDQAAVERLLDLLAPHSGAVSVDRGSCCATFTVDATSPEGAVTQACILIRGLATEAGLPSWPIVEVEALDSVQQDRRVGRLLLPR